MHWESERSEGSHTSIRSFPNSLEIKISFSNINKETEILFQKNLCTTLDLKSVMLFPRSRAWHRFLLRLYEDIDIKR
ncbi:MAG: hypothetical protein JZU67_05710, partial [Burkholderiaceae bacterium]|nr:hypothetical protein [Burkholderiaceae bacterium]